MKIKSILLPTMCFIVAGSLNAAPLSPSEALGRLNNSNARKVSAKFSKNLQPIYTSETANGIKGAYLFSAPGAGFMIVAADDVATPLLGYGDGEFSSEKEISPELKWWLEEYSRQIEWSIENGGKQYNSRKVSEGNKEAVTPLLKTLWDQETPYNCLCPGATSADPPAGSKRAVTGCVATSMAQVMKYFNYPERGAGGVIYTPTSLGYKLVMRFADAYFDWENMLNSYTANQYTTGQAEAVGLLMKACGYAVNMNYGMDVSGASGATIASAARKYFKYDINTRDVRRLVYTSDEWESMIYDNLKNIGPVIINGQSPTEGGHSFVCDGYDGKGYYHFNWGWGGLGNGYYSLDALNPDVQGTGGAAGGFNFMQNAILGMRPPVGEQKPLPAEMIQYGSLEGSISANSLSFTTSVYKSSYYVGGQIQGWYNFSDREVNVRLGFNITSETDANFQPQFVAALFNNRSDFSLNDGYGLTAKQGIVNLPSLPDGTYRLTFSSIDTEYYPNEVIPVKIPLGYSNCFILSVTNGVYSITNVPTYRISIEDVKVESELYAGKRAKFALKAKNNSPLQLTEGVMPQFLEGSSVRYQGESIMVTLNPGEEKEIEWIADVKYVAGGAVTTPTEFKLSLYNPETGESMGNFGTVTMIPATKLSVMMMGFSITDAKRFTAAIIDGKEYMSIQEVKEPSDIEFNLKYSVKSGFFDSMVRMSIMKIENGILTPYRDDVYAEWQMMPASSTPVEIKVNVNMEDADKEAVYALVVTYTSGYSQSSFGTFYFMLKDLVSGVEDILFEADEQVEYYNLQGQEIANPTKGDVVIKKVGGKSKKIIF